MAYVPCIAWVKKGVAKQRPDKVELSKDELERIIKETSDNIGNLDLADQLEVESDEEGATAATVKLKKGKKRSAAATDESTEGLEEYELDKYDDEEDETPWDGIAGISYYSSNKEDPYITIKDELDDESDAEDFEIKPTDNLILVGRAAADHSRLEIHIYNGKEDSFYCHHDIILPSFPLAVEYINYKNPEKFVGGNYMAIGDMEPGIDVWNLDLVDSLEPLVTLGAKKKKKSKNKKTASAPGHSDAVLDLAWNSLASNVLASASADHTVGLWDLSQCTLVSSIGHHTEKVQSIQWHPYEAQSLLSGSFDHTVRIFDCRSPEDAHKTWKMNGEVERVTWNHHSPFNFLASTDQGMVYYFDARNDKHVFKLQAHTDAVTGLSLSSQIPGLLVTASPDKSLKVWDIQDNKPVSVLDKSMESMGELQCLSCCPDSPFVYAVGGEKEFKVFDIRKSAAVRKYFENRHPVELASGQATSELNANCDFLKSIDAMDLDTKEETTVSAKKKRKRKKKQK